MQYVMNVMYTVAWVSAFAFCTFVLCGGMRQPTVGRLLSTMRYLTWYFIVATGLTAVWFALSRLLLPGLSIAEESLPLAIVLFGTFLGVCWLGLMVICNTRLALALVRMHRRGEIVEWDVEATAAAAWCRRFRPVYRVVSWQNKVVLDNVLRSTLPRDFGRLQTPRPDSMSEEKPQ